MKCFNKICVFVIFAFVGIFAENEERFKVPPPAVDVSFGLGFNYDYLKSPLEVDFENARGFYSVNIPIRFVLSDELTDMLFAEIAENFTDDEYFMPNIVARQHANTTIRVDVPMLRGVCSFSHINVMSMNYRNAMGIPNFRFDPKFEPETGEYDVNMLMTGNVNTPINISLGWESMMFGYAYRVNELFTFALNLHRHRFYFRTHGNIDMDILGKVDVGAEGIVFPININYSMRNQISGQYSLERWTPTLAARIWNFDLLARFMFKDKAKGALSGRYVVPFFINPTNFTFDEGLGDPNYIMDNLNNFTSSKTETVNLETNRDMKWELPSVLTLKYNIFPERLSVSYSKFIGQTRLELVDERVGLDTETGEYLPYLPNGLDLRMGISTDHLLLLNASFGWFYGNMGIMSLNVDYGDQKKLLSNINEKYLLRYGRGVMLPTLSGGGIIGTKLQLMLELNLLPLTAFKTGVVYNF